MYVQSVSIEPSILTDHKGIAIYINVYGSSKYKNRGYWKLNKTFKMKAIEIIDRYWTQANIMNTFGKYWELTKYEVRNLAILMGKKFAFAKRQKEFRITKEIMELSSKKMNFPRRITFVIISNRIRHSLRRESKG